MKRHSPKQINMRTGEMTAALSWIGIPLAQARRLAAQWAAGGGKACGGNRMVDHILLLARMGVRVERKSIEMLVEADRAGTLKEMVVPLYLRLRKMAGVLPCKIVDEKIIDLAKQGKYKNKRT